MAAGRRPNPVDGQSELRRRARRGRAAVHPPPPRQTRQDGARRARLAARCRQAGSRHRHIGHARTRAGRPPALALRITLSRCAARSNPRSSPLRAPALALAPRPRAAACRSSSGKYRRAGSSRSTGCAALSPAAGRACFRALCAPLPIRFSYLPERRYEARVVRCRPFPSPGPGHRRASRFMA